MRKSYEPVPSSAGKNTYLTAVAKSDDELIEIIDVERILDEFKTEHEEISDEVVEECSLLESESIKVVVCDDSRVARTQVIKALSAVLPNAQQEVFTNGKDTFDYLRSYVSSLDQPTSTEHLILISDIEMPIMDGYKLTSEIRSSEALKDLYVILHSSLSGTFNQALIEKVGANQFLPKFNPDSIGKALIERLESISRKSDS